MKIEKLIFDVDFSYDIESNKKLMEYVKKTYDLKPFDDFFEKVDLILKTTDYLEEDLFTEKEILCLFLYDHIKQFSDMKLKLKFYDHYEKYLVNYKKYKPV